MSKTKELRRLLLVLSLATVARLAVIVPNLGVLNDPDNYLPLARSLAEGRGFCLEDGLPTAYRPPLYPIVLAPLVASVGDNLPLSIAAFHLTLGCGTVALTYLTARRWGYSSTRATIAALVVALDPVTIDQSRSVMTETLAACLVAATLAMLTISSRRGLALGGFAFGLTSLCRPSLLPWPGLYGATILLFGPGTLSRRLIDVAIVAFAVLVTLLPWAVRNARYFGEPIWTTTHGGYTLALANNPVYYADVLDGPPGAVWSGANQAEWFDRITKATAEMSHLEADRYLRNQGLRMLRERPGSFLRASLARLGRFWGIAPSGAVYPWGLRVGVAVWTLPLWIALTVGLGRRDLWKRSKIAAPLVLVTLTGVHMAFWTDMRMRVPLISAIGLVAAGGVDFSRRRPSSDQIAFLKT